MTDRNRIITPDTDPDRFSETETALFRQGKCGHQVEPGALDIEREYCCAPSRPGASFGQCPVHDAELLLDNFPDGTRRRDADPGYESRGDYAERLAAWAALIPAGSDEFTWMPDTLRELRDDA